MQMIDDLQVNDSPPGEMPHRKMTLLWLDTNGQMHYNMTTFRKGIHPREMADTLRRFADDIESRSNQYEEP